MKLTKNFNLDEFLTSTYYTPQQLSQYLSKEQKENIYLLALQLQKIRDKIDFPLKITSGFRPPFLNQQVGGSNNSLHLSGKACDFTAFSKDNNKKVLKAIVDLIKEDKILVGELIVYLTQEDDQNINRFHFSIPNLEPLKFQILLLSKEGTKAYAPCTIEILEKLAGGENKNEPETNTGNRKSKSR
jgi:putative chitinase